jgi:hypothetical protein
MVDSALATGARNELRNTLIENYDHKNRGWGTIQKFLDADIIAAFRCSENSCSPPVYLPEGLTQK